MVRMTPCTPCCETCVVEAFQKAGAALHDSFVVVGGLDQLDAGARSRYVESVVGSTESKVFLVIETPAPARAEAGDDESTEVDEEAGDGEPEKAEAN